MTGWNNLIEIIYPDRPGMDALCGQLQKEMLSFRIPKNVTEKTGIASLSDVKEPWLIVLCTPDTKEDEKVKARIRGFADEGHYHHILTLLAGGKPEESFPEELTHEKLADGRVIEHEPLAANITADTEQESLRLLKTECVRLLAPVLGVTFDELMRRRQRQIRKTLMTAGVIVLAAAAVFLVFAFSRVRKISSQNENLQQKYAQAEEENEKTQAQRDAAREQFALSTAVNAKNALNAGDSELALLLCLEFLPETGQGTELEEVFVSALGRLCEDGYVPVTTQYEYDKTRYEEAPEETEEDSQFPREITLRIPEGYNPERGDTFTLKRDVWSEEYGYAVYGGSFYFWDEDGKHDNEYRTRICFADHPENNYYLTDEEGNPVGFSGDLILPDGSFLCTWFSPEDVSYRYNPLTKEYLPFFDGQEYETAGDREGFASPYGYISPIKDYMTFEGSSLIFGPTVYSGSSAATASDTNKIHIFTPEPFRETDALEGLYRLEQPEGKNLLLGRDGTSIYVYSLEPFALKYTITDEYTSSGPADYEAFYPDGRSILCLSGTNLGFAFYDLNTGKRLCELKEEGLGGFNSFGFSSEGYFMATLRETPFFINPETGEELEGRKIPDAGKYPEIHGPADAASGFRSASAVVCGEIVYEYHEDAVPVPESLEERIALAERLLNGRKLTAKERKTYNLEQPAL
ncbi:MAG: hypothetical protein IJH99_04395 [Eubacterium sp.]|nr:hypothetical protein [Eubacterium sp.]